MMAWSIRHRKRVAVGLALAGVLAGILGPTVPRASARRAAQAASGLTYRLVDTWTGVPWQLTAGRFGRAGDVGVAADGTIHVLDTRHAAVHVYGTDGRGWRVFPLPPPGGPSGYDRTARRLDVAPDGSVYVLSELTRPEGATVAAAAWVERLSAAGDRMAGFYLPRPYVDVAAGPDGELYLARTQPLVVPTPEPRQPAPTLPGAIEILDWQGASHGRIEDPALFYPVSVDVDVDGTVYVANRVPSPWNYEQPTPRPTPPPAFRGRLAQTQAAVEGVAIFDADHRHRETIPFPTPEDVGVGPSGAYVSRNVEVFTVPDLAVVFRAPGGQLNVGFSDGVMLHLAITRSGGMVVSMAHCYFQGVVRLAPPVGTGGAVDYLGGIDRPRLAGPVHPQRVAAGQGVALLQDRFLTTGDGAERRFFAVSFAPEPQTVQRWSTPGVLTEQVGLCAGSLSDWLPDTGGALWVQDVAMDGDVIYTVDPNLLHRRPDAGFPQWSFWPGTVADADEVTRLAAVSADADRVAVLDVGTGTVAVLDAAGVVQARWPVGGVGPNGLPSDVALSGDRVVLADTGRNRLEVRDLRGQAVSSWPTHDGPRRIDASPDGSVFVLGGGGWAMRYDPTGRLTAAWPMPDRTVTPTDIAVGDDGRVVVSYLGRERVEGTDDYPVYALTDAGVWVFEPGPVAPAAEPEPGTCLTRPDKRAEPHLVKLGGEVEVRLQVDGWCPGHRDAVQVALLMDTSRSMNWGGAIDRARQLAVSLIGALDPRVDQLALVTFDEAGELVEPLSDDLGAQAVRVSGLEAWGDTLLAPGIAVAQAELMGPRRDAAARPVMVIVTDGEFHDHASAAAELARRDGIAIYALALPHGGLPGYLAALQMVTGDPYRVLVEPDPIAVENLFRAMAGYRAEPGLFEQLQVRDVVPAEMRYVAGSADPPAAFDGATLSWDLGAVNAATGVALRYRLEPLLVGDWPTNVTATATYRDATGADGALVFPVPTVRVWDLSSLTERAFLPFGALRSCFRSGRPVDVILAMDASESMAQLVGGETKLALARRAAARFVGLLRLPHDRAAVVSFNQQATRQVGLTGDRAQVERALAAVSPAPGTRIDRALALAGAILRQDGSPTAQGVVILLTDGLQSGPAAPVMSEAQALKEAEVMVFTIGLGEEMDAALLQEVASSADGFYESPSAADLAAIYTRILGALACRVR